MMEVQISCMPIQIRLVKIKPSDGRSTYPKLSGHYHEVTKTQYANWEIMFYYFLNSVKIPKLI